MATGSVYLTRLACSIIAPPSTGNVNYTTYHRRRRNPMRTHLSFLLLALSASAADSPTVSVTGGPIRGGILEKGGAVFKGIPFAQPPVGDLRWREPQPVRPWRGVRDAIEYSAACIQNPIQTGNKRLANLYGIDDEPTEMVRAISEDCLYLNIWVPEWPAKALKPIMLYLYGGSNVVGSGADYDGGALATHGVIVVTINYRLGALGFFSHPELTKESPHHASGNYGLLDQVAALEWVQENIAAFGGDPKRITIAGESAGS